MASPIKETDNGDGTKRVQQWDDNGRLIYDVTADHDTVFGSPAKGVHPRRSTSRRK